MLAQSLLNDIKSFLLSRFPEDNPLLVREESTSYENTQDKPSIHADEVKFSTDLTSLVLKDIEADLSVPSRRILGKHTNESEDKTPQEKPAVRYSVKQTTEDISIKITPKEQVPRKVGLFDKARIIPNLFENLDESFNVTLTKYIDKAGMTDADCYKKAQLNKSHFNKIKNDPNYNVQKDTVFALIFALSLSKEDADILLSRAGYAFSSSSKFDTIIEYCINHKIYNLLEVNEILYTFDQKLLGSGTRR